MGSDAPATGDFSAPVKKPRKSAFKLFGEVLEHGGPGYLQFAITNICNARCDFCGFAVDRFDPRQGRSVTLKEAKDTIDIAVRNHIGYLLFVGALDARKDPASLLRAWTSAREARPQLKLVVAGDPGRQAPPRMPDARTKGRSEPARAAPMASTARRSAAAAAGKLPPKAISC